jgi:hypothetical protein
MNKTIMSLCIAGILLGSASTVFAKSKTHRRTGNTAKPMTGNQPTKTAPGISDLSPLPAATPDATASTSAPAPGIATVNATGSITALDVYARSLDVAGHKFRVPDSVAITINGTTESWGDDRIKVGAMATVNYTASSSGIILFLNRVNIIN